MVTLGYYAILAVATIGIAGLNWLIYRRTGTLVFALGGGLIYYWTFLGPWTLIKDLASLDYDTHYAYLFGKMFPVSLDGDYFTALVLYTVFGLAIFISIYGLAPPQTTMPVQNATPRAIQISHQRLIGMTILAVCLSFFMVRDRLAEAVIAGMSGYEVTSGPDGKDSAFLLHQLFSSFAVIPWALGVSVLAAGHQGRYILGRRTALVTWLYAAVSGVLVGFGMLMGNKNELFWGLVMGVAFYLVNVPRPRIGRLAVLGTSGIAVLAVIDFMRSLAITELTTGFSWRKAGDAIAAIVASNEAFAAHFSMYGVLHYSVPITWGSSIASLLASFVPRFLWPERPATVYQSYVEGVGALPGQGYTIHHATGWYLNFGWLGVLVGGIVLGAIWTVLYRGMRRVQAGRSSTKSAYYAACLAAFTGGMAVLLRNGIEVYKPLAIFAVVVPIVVVRVASFGNRHDSSRRE